MSFFSETLNFQTHDTQKHFHFAKKTKQNKCELLQGKNSSQFFSKNIGVIDFVSTERLNESWTYTNNFVKVMRLWYTVHFNISS